jgi:hypothetical protein
VKDLKKQSKKVRAPLRYHRRTTARKHGASHVRGKRRRQYHPTFAWRDP